jgi:hypothetical protein
VNEPGTNLKPFDSFISSAVDSSGAFSRACSNDSYDRGAKTAGSENDRDGNLAENSAQSCALRVPSSASTGHQDEPSRDHGPGPEGASPAIAPIRRLPPLFPTDARASCAGTPSKHAHADKRTSKDAGHRQPAAREPEASLHHRPHLHHQHGGLGAVEASNLSQQVSELTTRLDSWEHKIGNIDSKVTFPLPSFPARAHWSCLGFRVRPHPAITASSCGGRALSLNPTIICTSLMI